MQEGDERTQGLKFIKWQRGLGKLAKQNPFLSFQADQTILIERLLDASKGRDWNSLYR
jgi:hypothetical protein